MEQLFTERTLRLPTGIDTFACGFAREKNLTVEALYSDILNFAMSVLHTIKYDNMQEGYRDMAKINLDLSQK